MAELLGGHAMAPRSSLTTSQSVKPLPAIMKDLKFANIVCHKFNKQINNATYDLKWQYDQIMN